MAKTLLPPLSDQHATLPGGFFMDDDPLLECGVADVTRTRALLAELRGQMAEGVHCSDNLLTWGRNVSPITDLAFRKAWSDNCVSKADVAIMWRRYILCSSAYHCVQLDGDFVECGALYGTGIKTVIDYFGRDHFKPWFWAYDTFDWNPVAGHAFSGQQAGLFDRVRQRFEGYGQVRLVRGLLPDSLEGNSPERIAFMHIDLNSAEFEVAVLDRLFERMIDGAILILDDYEWAGPYRPQKLAEDKWFDERGYRVIPLPTGQGMVIKRAQGHRASV